MHRIFQEDPGVFARAFHALHIPLPDPVDASIITPDLTEIVPIERRVDTLLRFELKDGTSLMVAIEAQLKKDPDKPGAWAHYATHIHQKYKVPAVILVVCHDPATARWAQGPVEFGPLGVPTITLRTLVLGPHNVPRITDQRDAERDIPLATLSAVTHAHDPEVGAILKTLAAALKTVDDDTARIFAELTELGLGDASAAKIWRDLMTVPASFFRSQTSQMLRAMGVAEAVIDVLEERGLFISDQVRERIMTCTDKHLLLAWNRRAMTVETAEEIFG